MRRPFYSTKRLKYQQVLYLYRRMKKITKEDLLSELQSCFQKHGEINRRIFDEDKDFSSGKTVYNKFGSFSNACECAGVPHNNKPQKKEKVSVNCRNCGSEKEVYPYRLNVNENKRFFCNNECQGEWWSRNLTGEDHPLFLGGGEWSDKMGSMWHKKRESCLDRDNYRCRICDISQAEHIELFGFGLDVHHIEPRRKFYNSDSRSIDEANKMDNLITLCREHHNKVESGEIEVEV